MNGVALAGERRDRIADRFHGREPSSFMEFPTSFVALLCLGKTKAVSEQEAVLY